MDIDNIALAEGLISPKYISQGAQALTRRRRLIKALLSERRMPEQGWDEATIELFVKETALMDSNNFLDNVGVGEREARCASALVHRRSFGLCHGVGRSGDLTAEQPKAAGSSLLAKLSNLLAADALRAAGLSSLGAVTVLPAATGMALLLSLLALKAKRPEGARYVVWPRIDQKTCIKAVAGAGLQLVVVPLAREGDQLCTDVAAIAERIAALGPDSVVCVLTTTSCFAPRAADRVAEVARLCAREGVGHIINNAYGVQSAAICAAVEAAWRGGRVDAVVQSTDKNFLVPVGGALVAAGAKDPSLVAAVNAAYPGRAAIGPSLDLLLTLLHLGRSGWRGALAQREALAPYLRQRLAALAAEEGEAVLATPDNPISFAMTLGAVGLDAGFFGSMLFQRCVSGTRAVGGPAAKGATVAGIPFACFGAHVDECPVPYLTAAAAIGSTREDVDALCTRLRACFADARRRKAKMAVVPATGASAATKPASAEGGKGAAALTAAEGQKQQAQEEIGEDT